VNSLLTRTVRRVIVVMLPGTDLEWDALVLRLEVWLVVAMRLLFNLFNRCNSLFLHLIDFVASCICQQCRQSLSSLTEVGEKTLPARCIGRCIGQAVYRCSASRCSPFACITANRLSTLYSPHSTIRYLYGLLLSMCLGLYIAWFAAAPYQFGAGF